MLSITPHPKVKNLWHLKRNDATIGTLDIKHAHGNVATAHIADEVWHFRKLKILQNEYAIYKEKNDAPAAIFNSGWLNKGGVHLGSDTFHWKPIYKKWTHWTWYDNANHNRLEIIAHQRPLGMYATIVDHTNETFTRDEMFLTLLGWYMILTQNRDITEHIASGIHLLAHAFTNPIQRVKD